MKPPRVMLSAKQLDALRGWSARHRGTIKTVMLFGSRATGTACHCSDVDIAVAVLPRPGETMYTTYFFESGGWKEELSRLLSASVDLQLYCEEFDHTWRYCRRGHVVIWPRAHMLSVNARTCSQPYKGAKVERLPRMLHKALSRRIRSSGRGQ